MAQSSIGISKCGGEVSVDHSKNITIKGFLFTNLLRLVSKTWRVHIEGKVFLDQYYETGKPCFIGFWHGKYVPIFPLLEGYEACIITSLSTRGNVIGEICRSFGYKNAQIPDEPRLDAFRQLLHELKAVQVYGTSLDGPLGPYHQTKHGLIRLSGMLGSDLLPVTVYNSRHLTASKRWDKLEIPLPFSRLCVIFGDPISIPSHVTRIELQTLSERIGHELDELQIQAKTALWRKKHA